MMIRNSLKFLIEKVIMVLWFAIGTAITLLFIEMMNGGIGQAGWMGFVYIMAACLSFLAIRLLRVAQGWLETPMLEEV